MQEKSYTKNRLTLLFVRGTVTGMDIIAHIKERGMTVSAVARMAGVTRPTIYELGDMTKNPNLKTIKAVASVLGLTPAQIREDLAE